MFRNRFDSLPSPHRTSLMKPRQICYSDMAYLILWQTFFSGLVLELPKPEQARLPCCSPPECINDGACYCMT